MGALPPKSIPIRGISVATKTHIINCYCRHIQIDPLTGHIEAAEDIKELLNENKTGEKSLLLIDIAEMLLKEIALIHRLNTSINGLDWCGIVVLVHCDYLYKSRYDAEIFIKIPTESGRKEIMDGLVKKMKTKGMDAFEIARKSPGIVTRDTAKLISMVSTRAISRATDNGKLDLAKSGTVTHVQFPPSLHQPHIQSHDACITTCDFVGYIEEWKNII